MAEGKERGRGAGKAGLLIRSLRSREHGGICLLEAVREGGGARFFFASGTPAEKIAPGAGWKIGALQGIGGAPVVQLLPAAEAGAGEAAQAVETAAEYPLVVGGQKLLSAATSPETGLFAGLDTGFAERNGQPAEIVLDWLRYHVETHGMNAALILDRARPGSDPRFAEFLRHGAAGIAGLKRLVLLDAPVPLGRNGLPGESHPFCAPDAPGKGRMEIPPSDPWAAPLGETVIYELVRSRFLALARTVMNIDVSDILAPPEAGGRTLFERVCESPGGVIALEGRHAYPWRLRKGRAAAFGDHHLVRFDSRSTRRRWCIAPARLPEGAIWRMLRVTGAPAPGAAIRFWRCMALRHPGVPVSRIVPKSSLVEDPELLSLMQQRLNARPVRMPARALRDTHARDRARDRTGDQGGADDGSRTPACEAAQKAEHAGAAGGYRVTIVTTMKNEGPFILEWLAFHRMIGVSDFLIYTNDCTDGTDTMLDLLQKKGLVQHRENPFRRTTGLRPQHAALQAAGREALVQESDWLICMDVDEFINIRCGSGRLADLFDAVEDANMISLTWRLFGNNDIHAYSDAPVTAQFTRCAPELARKPHQAWGFKTLYRNLGIFRKLGVHRPKGLHPQLAGRIRWVNGSGRSLPERMYRNGWRSTVDTFGYDLVQLNHYAVRSAESFLVKRDRGRVNHVMRDQGLAYWFRMNNNAEEEHSIIRLLPALRKELAGLMADPEIAAAHAHAVRCHRRKIAELKACPEHAAFYREITGPRLEKLSRMHSRFGANVFLVGPDCIPDEIVGKDPAEPFFFTVDRVSGAAR